MLFYIDPCRYCRTRRKTTVSAHACTTLNFRMDRCSTENSELFGACCTSTFEYNTRHSATEIIALAASSTENTVQASCRNLQGQVNENAGISS